MPHPVIFQNAFKSIVKEANNDVYFLVTEGDGKKHYRVLPRNFVIRSEPNSPVLFLTQEKTVIL